MGIAVMIMGDSGTGKSTSIRNLKDVGIINVFNKPLPFKNDLKTVVSTDSCPKVISVLERAQADVIVIDDFQGLLATQFFGRALENGYAKFTEMALGYYRVIRAVESLPTQRRVYFMSHMERENGREKVKTIGKMLDEKLTVEGLFTIVLKTVVMEGQYFFQTHNSGSDTVKSPMGMFEEDLIPNDLAEVDRAICDYYNINQQQGEKK